MARVRRPSQIPEPIRLLQLFIMSPVLGETIDAGTETFQFASRVRIGIWNAAPPFAPILGPIRS
jgi:hypothetical protein